MEPACQTAITQTQIGKVSLPLTISHGVPVPSLPACSPFHVLVRISAVALNPTDWKMVTHFPMPDNVAGCDFCGVVVEVNDENNSLHLPGSRVCGGTFPYNYSADSSRHNGAFSQWVVADSRLLLRVPQTWTDLQGAALGGVGWGTVGLALYLPDALGLVGRPSKPSTKAEPVLVYGGGTATGTMACQVLKMYVSTTYFIPGLIIPPRNASARGCKSSTIFPCP